MKLIPNARDVALKSYSQIAQYLAGSIITAYQVMPAKWQDALPVSWVLGLALVCLVFGTIGRVIEQPALARTATPPAPAAEDGPEEETRP